MALTITHCATVLSLSQLAGEADVDGGSPAATSTPASSPSPASPAKGAATTPEKAVRDLADGDSLLPLYSFPSHDGFEVKRVRSFGSFGDLQAAAVPDVDDPARCVGGCAAGWGGVEARQGHGNEHRRGCPGACFCCCRRRAACTLRQRACFSALPASQPARPALARWRLRRVRSQPKAAPQPPPPLPCRLCCSGAARGYASSDDDEAVSLDGSSDSGASAQVGGLSGAGGIGGWVGGWAQGLGAKPRWPSGRLAARLLA